VTLPIYHLIPNAPKPVAPHSHVVEADGWLFVTGQLATDPDDDSLPLPEGIEAQTRKVMDNLKCALAGAGAGFEHVVYVRIFLTDFERDYAAFNQLYTDYFRPDRLPARSRAVQCTGLEIRRRPSVPISSRVKTYFTSIA
jgi:2-iminobutanoate/2-iminopropanoate deaminase